jgi:hypothetical protein
VPSLEITATLLTDRLLLSMAGLEEINQKSLKSEAVDDDHALNLLSFNRLEAVNYEYRV